MCAYPELGQEHSESEIVAIKQEITALNNERDWLGVSGKHNDTMKFAYARRKMMSPSGKPVKPDRGWPEEP